MASSIPGELIPSASVWHAPGITPCAKTIGQPSRPLAGGRSSLMTVVGIGGLTDWVKAGKGPTHSDTFLKTFLKPRSVSCRRFVLGVSVTEGEPQWLG